MAIADEFQTLCSNLTVDNRGTISDRYCAITKRLNLDFWESDSETLHSRYVGSYGRGTAARGFHDLDMLFHLPAVLYRRYDAYKTNGQSALLQAVSASIKRRYPSTDVGGDGQVVVVRFADQMRFEVVPVFQNKDVAGFVFPDANGGGQWRVTNPLPEIAAVSKTDALYNGNLKRLCRMARAWKRTWNVWMGGLLIDTLALSFLRAWPHRKESFPHYDAMSRDFFAHLANQSADKEYWLAPGSRQRVQRRGPFVYKAKRCHNIAREAIAYQAKGMSDSATAKWREIYGSYYP